MDKIKGWMIALGVVAVFGFWLWSTYNTVIGMQEGVKQQWAQVDNVYARRSDLIPQLSKVVKAAAANEKDIISSALEMRSKATSIQIDASNVTAEQLKQFSEVQSQLGQSLGRLMAVAEAYPDIKSNENFLKLQDEVVGSDNRISTERKRFNDVVGAYNTKIKKFPTNLLGFTEKPYFEITKEQTEVPDLNL